MKKFPVSHISDGLLFIDELVVFDIDNPGDSCHPAIAKCISLNMSVLRKKWGSRTLLSALEFATSDVVGHEPKDEVVQ